MLSRPPNAFGQILVCGRLLYLSPIFIACILQASKRRSSAVRGLLSLDLHNNVAHILKLDSLPCSQEPMFEEFIAGDRLPSPEEPEGLQDAPSLSSDVWVNCSAVG
jgi:hypothetical protein